MKFGLFWLCIYLLYSCTPDRPEYITESEARLRLYSLAILKCSESGIDPSTKGLDIFAFVEKQFKTNSLSESKRKQVSYYKKDFQKCEQQLLLFPIEKCNFKDFDLFNLISQGKLCKLDPASYFQF